MAVDIVLGVLVCVALAFGLVVTVGAPYLPTLRDRTEEALDLLSLRPGQTMLELGCGDGRVLRAAATRGIRSVGYELNPFLVICAKLVTWKYRRLTEVKWANFWQATWPPADGVYVFLLDKYMSKLNTKIMHDLQGEVRVVSFAFAVPERTATTEKEGLFVYDYQLPPRLKHKKIEK